MYPGLAVSSTLGLSDAALHRASSSALAVVSGKEETSPCLFLVPWSLGGSFSSPSCPPSSPSSIISSPPGSCSSARSGMSATADARKSAFRPSPPSVVAPESFAPSAAPGDCRGAFQTVSSARSWKPERFRGRLLLRRRPRSKERRRTLPRGLSGNRGLRRRGCLGLGAGPSQTGKARLRRSVSE